MDYVLLSQSFEEDFYNVLTYITCFAFVSVK